MATKSSPFTALLDACVLYPAPLRDLLIQIATTGLYRAKWTNEIQAEWVRSLLTNRADLTEQQLSRTVQLMNEAVLDCLIVGHEVLIPALSLPDPDDRHVLAAATHGRCDAIVTFNLVDFPNGVLKKHHVEALHPDDFIFNQFDLDKARVITSAYQCRNRLKNPPMPPRAYLDTLQSMGLPKTAAELQPFLTVI